MLTWILFLILFLFRGRILIPIIGRVRMFMFDAVMWTIWAAVTFATPAIGLEWLSYVCGVLYVFFAFSAARTYVTLSEAQGKENGKENGQGKSDTDPTEGN